ncbi:MAG: zinc dependent phospholipase C family protein, partial [Deltaproteobacteria bacterium]|nr:zinc dependent phospholipase C family protein [Deltaproteobacteria bacterium]
FIKSLVKLILYTTILLLLGLMIPETLYAWGPGAHMSYALSVLEQLKSLHPQIASLLGTNPQVFLYGTIAADIILGKKYAGELYHCHNWKVAFDLLDKAQTDREKTFIYGYLSHLAVDTVAHNFYVPYKIIFSYKHRTLKHTYWEMRFDEKMDPKVWQTLGELSESEYLDLDDFLQSHLKRTLFSFKTNKRIFNSLLLLQRMKRWRRASELLSKRSIYELKISEVEEFKKLCLEVVIEFLKNPKKSRVLRADPSGKLKLLYAKEIVQDLKRYQRLDLINEEKTNQLITKIRTSFKEGLYQPVDLPLITDAI